MRDTRNWPREAGRAQLRFHATAVDNRAPSIAPAVGAASERLRSPARISSVRTRCAYSRAFGASVFAHRVHICVPIAALDGELGNQVMQIGFVNNYHSGMLERRLVAEVVIAVIADLIQDRRRRRTDRKRRAWS